MSVQAPRWDRDDLEPRIAHVLSRKMQRREQGGYSARTDEQVTRQLEDLFRASGLRDIRISQLARMTGGASKEQFAFTLEHGEASAPERMVLRMDPWMGIVETCRGREAELLQTYAGIVPVPPLRFVDADGEHLGAPGLITALVPGATAPTDVDTAAVSGIGIRFAHWIPKLAPQFVDNLAQIHLHDWQADGLSYFEAPQAGTTQAAQRQVNWWSRVWREDLVEPDPLATFVERWLREHAPVCARPVMVHGDYRIGNFMFVEPSGAFSAVLDWELAHPGDFHEDLAWCVQRLFSTPGTDGEPLICGLLPRAEFLSRYADATGFTVDPSIVRYYEILSAWKCIVINNATACCAARESQSHQDIVLTWLSFSTAVFRDEIVRLIREAEAL
ncbi:MAG: phosphotransferase family protein [Gammaproteobacteria bacterium]